jgi:hypothetical protein
MIRLSGRMTPRVIASRSSATFLPEKSVRDAAAAAGFVAAAPTLRAPFAACCWRPRALPPALAARLRAGVLLVELELERRVVEPDEREPEPLLRDAVLRELVERELDPLARELDERELDEREPEPLAREVDDRDPDPPPARDFEEEDPPERLLALREVDREPPDDDLRDPPEPRPDDDPPPLPPFDSAIALLL